jgi:hypothetical protein
MSSTFSAWSGGFDSDQSNTDEPGLRNIFDMHGADVEAVNDWFLGSESLGFAWDELALDWQPDSHTSPRGPASPAQQHALLADSSSFEGSSTVDDYGFTSGTSPTETHHQWTDGILSMESAETSTACLASSEPITHTRSTPRLQCWQHGCRGRTFTSFSNYRRHVKEKEGKKKKAVCSRCGQQFARTSGRNIHYAQRRCKITLLDANGVPARVRMEPE